MVGNRLVYPTYVLQAGAFLAGALFVDMPFSQKMRLLGVFIVRFLFPSVPYLYNTICAIKRPDPRG